MCKASSARNPHFRIEFCQREYNLVADAIEKECRVMVVGLCSRISQIVFLIIVRTSCL